MKFEGPSIFQFLKLMEVNEAIKPTTNERGDVIYIFDLGDPRAMDYTFHNSNIFLIVAIYLAI